MAAKNNQNLRGNHGDPPSAELDISIPPEHGNDLTSSALDEGSAAESVSVLFIDIVGFAKLPVNQQLQVLRVLLKAVRSTDEYKRANASDNLLRLPTGDGMALVFLNTTPVAPACCAKSICKALRSDKGPGCGIRMGIHSGPVYRDRDIDDKPNVTGDGINLAQRVMNCGDEGHILLSASVAEFLRAFDEWAAQIHDIGNVKVKHDKVMHIFNLYGEGFGNSSLPNCVRGQRRQRHLLLAGAAVVAALLFLTAFLAYYLWPPSDGRRIESIAIFPLTVDDTTEDGGLKNAANDIAFNIRNDLVKVNLMVKPPPDSLMLYRDKEIDAVTEGRDLDVQAVLKGRIIRRGEDAMIEVSLTDVQTNSHLWSKSYPYTPRASKQISFDIIPALIKRDISAEEHAKLEKNYTDNAEATRLYNEGRRLLIDRDVKGSMERFRQSIDQDPNFAPAHASLANALSLIPGYDIKRPEEAYPEAKEEVKKALSIDNRNVEAYYTSGYIKANYDWDWEGARLDFERALELSKRADADALYYYAFNYLIPMKRMDDAIKMMEEALKIGPKSPIINTNLGWTYFYAGRDEEALRQYEKTRDKHPNFSRIHRRLQDYYDKKKNYARALEEYKVLDPDNYPRLLEAWQTGKERGYWEQRLRKMEERAERGSYVPMYDRATIYAHMGENDEALSLLEKAVEERSEGLIKVNVNPVFQNLRSHPKFKKVVESLKLPY